MIIYEAFQPKYTAYIGDHRVESHSIMDLLNQGASTELDYGALNVFIRTGTFIGSNTAFKAIRFAPPPAIESLDIRPMDLSREQILDAFNDLFRQAMSRCMRAAAGRRVRMGISAGRDSRHILFELYERQALPDLCWTLDFAVESDAVGIARELATRVGVRHVVIPVSRSDFAAREVRKNRATNFSSIQHGSSVPALEVIGPDDVLYDGIGGDVLSAGLFLDQDRIKLVERGRIDEFIDRMVSKGTYSFLKDAALLRRADALERVSSEFRRHMCAPDPISSFYFWTRTRRDIASSAFALLRPQHQTVLAPYLDDDLFRFLSGLSAHVTVDHRLHTDAIAIGYPEFKDIPYGHKNELPWNEHRWEAWATLQHIYSRPSRLIVRSRLAAALARTLVSARHARDAFWLSRLGIYFTGLSDTTPYPS